MILIYRRQDMFAFGETEEYRPIEEILKELTQIEKAYQKVEKRLKEVSGKLE